MSLRRVVILLRNELIGSFNFIFIFAIAVPIVITIIISLLFGSFFTGKPKLGFADAGNSQVVARASEIDSFIVKEYDTAVQLKDAVAIGAVDMGFFLPPDFDNQVRSDQDTIIDAYIWGESLLKNRAILGFTIASLIRDVTGEEVPVNIITETIGADVLPWEDRLLPFIVLMAIVIGGMMVPATSLVNEKQKRTLNAITITPTSLTEVFVAKGAMGAMVSLAMAIVVLLLNRAWGAQPLLLILALATGAIMAATFGIILGALIKDINSLFAIVKGTGILLYAPAIVYMFPGIPQWIGRIFPTYYMIQPVIEITQQGATFGDILPELLIAAAIILFMMGILAYVIQRSKQKEIVALA